MFFHVLSLKKLIKTFFFLQNMLDISINIKEDNMVEDDETFTIELLAASRGAAIVGVDRTEITINDVSGECK